MLLGLSLVVGVPAVAAAQEAAVTLTRYETADIWVNAAQGVLLLGAGTALPGAVAWPVGDAHVLGTGECQYTVDGVQYTGTFAGFSSSRGIGGLAAGIHEACRFAGAPVASWSASDAHTVGGVTGFEFVADDRGRAFLEVDWSAGVANAAWSFTADRAPFVRCLSDVEIASLSTLPRFEGLTGWVPYSQSCPAGSWWSDTTIYNSQLAGVWWVNRSTTTSDGGVSNRVESVRLRIARAWADGRCLDLGLHYAPQPEPLGYVSKSVQYRSYESRPEGQTGYYVCQYRVAEEDIGAGGFVLFQPARFDASGERVAVVEGDAPDFDDELAGGLPFVGSGAAEVAADETWAGGVQNYLGECFSDSGSAWNPATYARALGCILWRLAVPDADRMTDALLDVDEECLELRSLESADDAAACARLGIFTFWLPLFTDRTLPCDGPTIPIGTMLEAGLGELTTSRGGTWTQRSDGSMRFAAGSREDVRVIAAADVAGLDARYLSLCSTTQRQDAPQNVLGRGVAAVRPLLSGAVMVGSAFALLLLVRAMPAILSGGTVPAGVGNDELYEATVAEARSGRRENLHTFRRSWRRNR